MRINTKASRREGKTLARQAMSLAQEEAEERREQILCAWKERRERILCEWDERLAAEKEAAIETEGPMRLWQVTRTCRGGYGTYSRFVAAAPTADLARRVHPSDYDRWDSDQRCFVSKHDGRQSEKGDSGEWTDAIDTLEVIEIGAAAEGIEQGTVLCASFHAG